MPQRDSLNSAKDEPIQELAFKSIMGPRLTRFKTGNGSSIHPKLETGDDGPGHVLALGDGRLPICVQSNINTSGSKHPMPEMKKDASICPGLRTNINVSMCSKSSRNENRPGQPKPKASAVKLEQP